MAISGAIHGGHAWGPYWWRILNLGILTSQKHSQERAGFSGALTGTNSARESGHNITPLNQAQPAHVRL